MARFHVSPGSGSGQWNRMFRNVTIARRASLVAAFCHNVHHLHVVSTNRARADPVVSKNLSHVVHNLWHRPRNAARVAEMEGVLIACIDSIQQSKTEVDGTVIESDQNKR